jgi:P27 family predicted phage terminase small subunit
MGRTGRPHKPTHLKLVQGDIHHSRHNKKEAKPKPILPEPPPELSEDARALWDKTALRLHACGLLTEIDGTVLAAYCQAYGRWAQAERGLADMRRLDPVTSGLMIRTKQGNVIQNPLVGTANKAMNDMVRFAVELGMSPSARSRVQANINTPTDDAERFFS